MNRIGPGSAPADLGPTFSAPSAEIQAIDRSSAEGMVVVGVHDTSAAEAALARGVAEAQRRDCGLHLVRVWREVNLLFSMTRAEVARLPKSESANRLLLERAAWQARELAPTLAVTTELSPGDLFETLADASKSAQVLILGTDSPGSDSDIALWLSERVQCPVIVVAAEPASA